MFYILSSLVLPSLVLVDYESLRIGGLAFAVVVFILGVLLILSEIQFIPHLCDLNILHYRRMNVLNPGAPPHFCLSLIYCTVCVCVCVCVLDAECVRCCVCYPRDRCCVCVCVCVCVRC